jgi:ubiquinone/menaquinone biosynthesis C-methylase UbiE
VNVYERYVLPRLTDLVMRNKADAEERATLAPLAAGVVVEVGIGSALNVPFYGPEVKRLYGVDPSVELWKIGRRRIAQAPFPIEFVPASAERIPLDDALADSVVSTWTLCTIPTPAVALAEMRRVLKPGGRFVFIEHGRGPESGVQRWQDHLTPMWRRMAGGCHMNRRIDDLIVGAGFHVVRLERGYAKGPKILAYLYKGHAERPD